MYPYWSEEEVWTICMSMLEKDSPFPDFGKTLLEFRSDFQHVFEEIREEHSKINRKYYRDDKKRPIVNPLHTAHYARLIYFFSHRLSLEKVDKLILDQLFLSIKTRCHMDLFYEVELKKYFLPEHAIGSVIGRGNYDDYFVVCQNCTIGNNRNIYPSFGKRVILRPGAIVLGNCKIGNNVQISSGSLVIDMNIPDNSTVFGRAPDLVIKETEEIAADAFFD